MTSSGLSVLGLTLVLAGCGQRGALYIPTAPAAAERASLLDALTAPPKTATPATPTSAPAPEASPSK